jgi:adenylate cyclase
MADIFVSYARQDKARVAPLVAALERQGWSAWWDPAIIPGQEFDDRIAEEIAKARAVVVVWTPASVASRWVRGEAREGADRGILIPLRFDGARLPIDARAVHTTDLDGWSGDSNHPAFQEVVSALSGLMKPAAATPVRAKSEHYASICVLPFVNMSGDPGQDYFSDGLSEELLNQLAQIKGLRVAARTSSFAFKGQNLDLKVFAEKLGVAHVLEGSVRKSGSRLRITAQFVNCADGYHAWSKTFDRELTDIFAVQEDIARCVATELSMSLALSETAMIGGTTNIEAYDLFLRAKAYVRLGGPPELPHAVALYRAALEADPNFALAWSELALAIAWTMVFMPEEAKEARVECERAANEALRLAPNSWASHLASSLRYASVRNWTAREHALNRCVEFAPHEWHSRYLRGFSLLCVGRARESTVELEAAQRVDPLSLTVSSMLQLSLTIEGRSREAETEYLRTLSWPGDREATEEIALMRAFQRGDPCSKLKEQMHRYLDKTSVPMPVLRELVDVIAQPDLVSIKLRRAFDEPTYQDATRQFKLALWAAQFGDTEFALAAARRAYVDMRALPIEVLWLPAYRNVRKDPRFKDLLGDLNIVAYWREIGKWGDFARPVGDGGFAIIG